MIAVFKREVGAYYKSVVGYLIAAFLLIFAGIYCMAYNLSGYYANFEYVLDSISFIYLIAVPIISMRAMAEEKRQKTDQLLYSLPLRLSNMVLGKYLAMLVVLLVPCIVLGCYPLILMQWGNVPLFTGYGTLVAFFLLGACLLSIGLFVSSITESQVAAAVITLVTLLLLYFMSDLSSFVSSDASASLGVLCALAAVVGILVFILSRNAIIAVLSAGAGCGGLYLWYQVDTSAFSGLFGRMMNAISVFDRFESFVNGIFDLKAVVYYVSIIMVFLFLTVQVMEKRRWSE